MEPVIVHSSLDELLERSHRLGRSGEFTNWGGGNTSCETTASDPVTNEPTRVLAIKGSGGHLGDLDERGLAYLDLDRFSALRDRAHPAPDDDSMSSRVAACCLPDGAAPSIDSAMHALIEAPHVDHLHPDPILSIACATDGEGLTRECFGDDVAWVPWIRPGWALGTKVAAIANEGSRRGAILGGHGLTTWGATSRACEAASVGIVEEAAAFIASRAGVTALGPAQPGNDLDEASRRARAIALAPVLRGLCSSDTRVVGRHWDDPAVLEFASSSEGPRLASLGTSCPDHLLRTKPRPMMVTLPASTDLGLLEAELVRQHARYRADYIAYYERYAAPSTPPMRSPDPRIVLIPGLGMWSFGPTPFEARITGEFFVHAITAMRGAEAISRYDPISDEERFRVEYWELEERKLRRRPKVGPLGGNVAIVTGGASGIGRATARRLQADGAAVVVADLDAAGAAHVARDLGDDEATSAEMDVRSEGSVCDAVEAAVARYGGVDIVVNAAGLSVSSPLETTTTQDWDLQHDVMSRGSFLVARETARVMRRQGLGGTIVYITSKNATAAGPANVAYGAAKAAQAHQVRLLAAELGPDGIRVNAVAPDGVVQGSGIFAGRWGDDRAAAHGIAREDLSAYYASRSLLGVEVMPEHVADAVAVLASDALSRTTGAVIPVDGGQPHAFPR